MINKKNQNLEENLEMGTPVVAKYGYNNILKKPFEFLFEFGYYSKNGAVVYIKGERNMQDSYAFELNQIRKASKEDLKNFNWGY